MADQPDKLIVSIMSGPDDGRAVRFSRSNGDGERTSEGAWTITIGRRDDCDICLPFDTQISRLHARLTCTDSMGWKLEDCGSRNGTFVGRLRLDGPHHISPGSLFRIGRTWMRLEHES